MIKCQAIIGNRYFSLKCVISAHTFLNARKSLVCHAKNSVTLPILKILKFYVASKRR